MTNDFQGSYFNKKKVGVCSKRDTIQHQNHVIYFDIKR